MKGDKNMEKKPIKVSFGTVITIIIAVIILIGCGVILYRSVGGKNCKTRRFKS